MNPGRFWTGIPTTDWLVVVGGVGCRTTSSLVHDPKENATPTDRQRDSAIEIPRILIGRAERRNVVFRGLQDGFLGQVHEHLGIFVTDPVDILG